MIGLEALYPAKQGNERPPGAQRVEVVTDLAVLAQNDWGASKVDPELRYQTTVVPAVPW